LGQINLHEKGDDDVAIEAVCEAAVARNAVSEVLDLEASF